MDKAKRHQLISFDTTELIARFNSGEQRAYDELFRELYRPLCFFAYKILSDFDKAEDLVQDNLLKLWQRREDFDRLEKIKSFLYISVRNSCFDELQRKKVRDEHWQGLKGEEPSEQNILDNIMQAEVVSRVFRAVDTLPEQCRRVIRMTFEEGMSPKEIAQELEVSVSTVSNQKMRGLILLKKRLSGPDVAIMLAILMPDIHKFLN